MGGPYFRKGLQLKEAPKIIDIAPTILYLMGLPVLVQMDGKVIEEAVEKEFLSTF